MSDESRAIADTDMLENFYRHLDGVHKAVRLLARRLIAQCQPDDEKLAFLLLRNSFTHDRSKLEGIEFPWIHQVEDKEKLILAIEHHQQVNPHHPEYWGGVNEMPPVAIAEMVCDWKARSEEFATDLREWIREQALKKYSIPPTGRVAKMIKKFVDLLLDPAFKDVRTLKKEES